jgi:hypothetical protein
VPFSVNTILWMPGVGEAGPGEVEVLEVVMIILKMSAKTLRSRKPAVKRFIVTNRS